MFKQNDEQLKEKFFNLNTRRDVSNILEIDEKSLRYFLYNKKIRKYNEFKILKRNGTYREICSPMPELKNVQRKLAYILSLVYNPKKCSYGFIQEKNIVQNASNHVKKSVILNIDLRDFFHQIHFGRVRGMLMSKPYSIGEEAATIIAQLSCYDGHLPQGAPSSPILTNMICVPLDNALMKFAQKQKITYTRYADDLSFSTFHSKFDSSVVYSKDGYIILSDELSHIINNNGFEINPEKIHLRHKNERQEITGIITNKFPNIRREYLKTLRAILHHCKNDGVYETAKNYIELGFCHNKQIISQVHNPDYTDKIINWFEQVIKGKIDFVKQVKGNDDMTFLSFAQKANEIFQKPLFDTSVLSSLNDIIKNNVFIIESDDNQGSGFIVPEIGLFTSYHVTEKSMCYKVYTQSSYVKEEKVSVIGNDINIISSDKDIDYAIYKVHVDNTLPVKDGDSTHLKIGDKVIIVGYPNANKGDSATIQSCAIIGKTQYFGSDFYKVSGRIVHGASGGAVFNSKNEIIGIIKGGVTSFDETDTTDKQGFVPIHLILEHMEKE